MESQWKQSDLALAEKFLNYGTRMQRHHNTEHANPWLQTDEGKHSEIKRWACRAFCLAETKKQFLYTSNFLVTFRKQADIFGQSRKCRVFVQHNAEMTKWLQFAQKFPKLRTTAIYIFLCDLAIDKTSKIEIIPIFTSNYNSLCGHKYYRQQSMFFLYSKDYCH